MRALFFNIKLICKILYDKHKPFTYRKIHPREWLSRRGILIYNSMVDSNLKRGRVFNTSDSLRCQCFKTLVLEFNPLGKLIIIIRKKNISNSRVLSIFEMNTSKILKRDTNAQFF